MEALEKLRKQALKSCQFRGHTMRHFSRKYRHWWYSECRVCQMGVGLNDQPDPSQTEIAGKAVALTCTA